MVPMRNQMGFGQSFHFREIENHAVAGIAILFMRIALERYMQYVTVPVQITALAVMIGNPVSGIELEFSGNGQHEKSGYL